MLKIWDRFIAFTEFALQQICPLFAVLATLLLGL